MATSRNILINIGNTHVQVGILDNNSPRLLERYDTDDIKVLGQIPLLEKMPVAWRARAVSVVPQLSQILQEHYGIQIRFLSPKDFHNLDFSLVDTSTLGMDRIANAAAAYAMTQNAVAVIDFGTCINTVAVSHDGRFQGGAILPGRMLLRKSLATYTAQLPLLPLRFERPDPIGANTQDAIAAGIDLGVIGAVRELLAETRRFLNCPDCAFLTAGGDAPYFIRQLPELTQGPDLLTLRGVATTFLDLP